MNRTQPLRDFWQMKRVRGPKGIKSILLLALIFAGFLSTLSLFDWWFKRVHIGDFWYFLVVSIFMWFGIFRILLNWYQLTRISIATVPKAESKQVPSVAIFTTAAPGEPLSMFKVTFEALSNLTTPCTVYFLDGTNDPLFKTLALSYGFNHLDMSKVEGAKAGKVNEALRQTTEEIILILDPDHLVFPNFLDEVLPFFNDQSIGFVQVSQGYYNQYRSPVALAAAEQTYLFYGPTQLYYGSNQQAVAIGANCVFRRTALESIGGHAHGLAEDLLTSIRLHAKGWKSHYHPVIVNRGLVPEDFDSFSKQQLKWSRGLFEVLFEEYPRLFNSLTLSAKFRYWTIGTFYLVGIRTLFFLLVPFFYFLFGWVAVNMTFTDFLVRAMPFAIFSLAIYWLSQQYLVDYKNEKGFYWRGMVMKFACWPVFTYGFLLTIFNKKIPYLPTAKDGSVKLSVFVWPHFIYLVLLLCSIAYHYQVGFVLKQGIQGILLKRQTLGMLSFSVLAVFQTLLSIVLIFRSMKRQTSHAWNEIYP
ncbi:MAG: hypothetical protein RLZZ382_1594 [Bacteroidota bacterium]